MHEACLDQFKSSDIAVLAAAVSDYRPSEVSDQKIKKSADNLNIELEKNPDILFDLGKSKSDSQILVGFALESNDEIDNAKGKLERKNLDFIVLNSLRDEGAGFGHETNKISILFANNKMLSFELKSKAAVAGDIVQQIIEL